MALAPAPQLSACLRAAYMAMLHTRVLGWGGEDKGLTADEADQIATLMDAVHNIPHLIENWERCDESLLRETLGDADKRCGTNLLAEYDRVVRELTATTP
jgi:hypothetical protein